MRLFYLSAALLVCVTFHAIAQNSFKPGYIQLQNGEHQSGLIGKVITGFPAKIEYKSTEDGEISTYPANEIQGYGIDGGVFYSTFSTPGSTNEWTFAEILTQGKLVLVCRNNLFFVYREGDVNVVHLDEDYRSKLKNITLACPDFAKRSRVVERTRESLTHFVKSYNECTPPPPLDVANFPRPVSFGFLFGYDNSSASFADNGNRITKFITADKLRDKAVVQLGIDMTFRDYKFSRHLGLYAGALYNPNLYKDSNTIQYQIKDGPLKTNITERNQFEIHQSELRFPVGIDFVVPIGEKLSMSARLGFVLPMSLGVRSSRPVFEYQQNGDETINRPTPPHLASLKSTVLKSASIGFDYRVAEKHRVRLQFSYSAGHTNAAIEAVSAADDIKGKYTSFSIMGGFIF